MFRSELILPDKDSKCCPVGGESNAVCRDISCKIRKITRSREDGSRF